MSMTVGESEERQSQSDDKKITFIPKALRYALKPGDFLAVFD